MGSGDGGRVVGSSDGPCVKTVGRKVGELVGQAEPRSWLPVVIFQPNPTGSLISTAEAPYGIRFRHLNYKKSSLS